MEFYISSLLGKNYFPNLTNCQEPEPVNEKNIRSRSRLGKMQNFWIFKVVYQPAAPLEGKDGGQSDNINIRKKQNTVQNVFLEIKFVQTTIKNDFLSPLHLIEQINSNVNKMLKKLVERGATFWRREFSQVKCLTWTFKETSHTSRTLKLYYELWRHINHIFMLLVQVVWLVLRWLQVKHLDLRDFSASFIYFSSIYILLYLLSHCKLRVFLLIYER